MGEPVIASTSPQKGMFAQDVSRIAESPPNTHTYTHTSHSSPTPRACPGLFLHHKMLYRAKIQGCWSTTDRHLGKTERGTRDAPACPGYLQPQLLREGVIQKSSRVQAHILVDLQGIAPSSGQHSWNFDRRDLEKQEVWSLRAPRCNCCCGTQRHTTHKHTNASPHQLHLPVGPTADELHFVKVGELHLQLLQLTGRLLICRVDTLDIPVNHLLPRKRTGQLQSSYR